MIDGQIREQRRWDPFIAPARHRQSLLPSGTAIDQRSEQRKIIREILEHPSKIPLQTYGTRTCLYVAHIAPLGELSRDHFLNRFAVCEVRRTTRTGPDEVVLAEREACREIGRLNQSADVRVRRRCEAKPVPPAFDHLPERADRDSRTIARRERVAFEEANCRRRAPTTQPD
jgi:hypothetical protein